MPIGKADQLRLHPEPLSGSYVFLETRVVLDPLRIVLLDQFAFLLQVLQLFVVVLDNL